MVRDTGGPSDWLLWAGVLVGGGGVMLLSVWQVTGNWFLWGAGVLAIAIGFVWMDIDGDDEEGEDDDEPSRT